MKVLLFCKGEYRYLFPAISHALHARPGADTSVVVFSAPAARRLRKTRSLAQIFELAGYLKSHVPRTNRQAVVEKLKRLETVSGTVPVNTMIHGDRILRRYSYEFTLSILASVCDFWDHILSLHPPDIVIGEVACAAEWIGFLKARDRRIAYLIPSASPVAGRFFFLASPDGMWSSMQIAYSDLQARNLSHAEASQSEDFIQDFRFRKTKPPFLRWAEDSPLRPQFSRFLRRIARVPFRLRSYLKDGQYEIGSYHGTSPWQPVYEDCRRICRHTLAEAGFFEHQLAETGPYVYFPLHVQPEFTTDVRAPFFTNQIALVEHISKSVPAGFKVLVKEHPGMKGERILSDYRALRRLNNVRLLSPSIDSHELICRAAAVLTITGSSAWEAILYEKPVIAFGPLYYGFSKLVYVCDSPANLPNLLAKAVYHHVPDHHDLLKFVAAFLSTAHYLDWGDPIRQPQITDTKNTGKIADTIAAEFSLRTASLSSKRAATPA